MRLLRVELARLGSRRAVLLLMLATVLLGALMAATAAWDSRPVSDREVARAQVQADALAGDPRVQEDLADCERNPEDYFGPAADPAVCERFLLPRAEDYLSRQPLDLGRTLQGRGLALTTMVTALLIVVGATFAGADWSTGSMSNQLLFGPRRGRLWLAKAAAVTVGALALATVVLGGFWVFLSLLAQARGIGTAPEVLHEIRWWTARGVALAAAGAVGGYALTMLLRSTVATLGVLFVYTVGGAALLDALPLERASRWSLSNNLFAWVKDGTTVFDPDTVCRRGLDACERTYVLGLGHAAAYLGVLLGLAVVLSLLSFRRRDVP